MALSLQFAGRSDRGHVRFRNEDALHLQPDRGLAVVADGMGGHPAGADASRLAVRTFLEHLGAAPHAPTSPDAVGDRMVESVERAHAALLTEGERDPSRAGMGTTLTALHFDPSSGRGALVHVGDSRAYRLRDGHLTRLSRDHTWVQERIDAGELDASVARVHPMAHVLTRVLGGGPSVVTPQLRSLTGRAGDVYLLCTDGLTAHLSDEDLRDALAGDDDSDRVATRLVDDANERGGSDNITVVVVRVGDQGSAPDPIGRS